MKKAIILGLMLIFFSGLVSAYNGTVNHDTAMSNSGADDIYRGFKVTFHYDYRIVNVTVAPSMTCNSNCRCIIWNATTSDSNMGEPVANVTLDTDVSDTSEISPRVNAGAGHSYVVACGNEVSYTVARNLGGAAWPDAREQFNWNTSGYITRASDDYTSAASNAYALLTIGVDNETGASPGIGNINLSINFPINGTYIGVDQIEGNGSKIWFNFTHDANGTYTVNVNDSRWSLEYNTTNERYYLNNTPIDSGFIHLTANITKTGAYTNKTNTTIFLVDVNNPAINPTNELENNQTIVTNGTLVTQINFTDDREIYSINVSFGNGTVIYNGTNLGLTHYEVNISYNVDTTPLNNLTARICDAHTDNIISAVDYREEDNGLKYIIDDNPLWLQDQWVHIYPKNTLSYSTPETEKLTDRYAFTFNKLSSPSLTETFVVESSEKIDLAKQQNYAAHLIIPNLGKQGYWVDFENNEATKHEINVINDYKVEVTIHGLKSSDMQFNSIGELNCLTSTYYYMNLNFTNQTTGADNRIVGEDITYLADYYTVDSFVSSHRIEFWYNGLNYTTSTDTTALAGGSSKQNVSSQVKAPFSVDGLNDTVNSYWIVYINGVGNSIAIMNHTVHDMLVSQCNNTINTKVINFTVKDDLDDGAVLAFDLEGIFTVFIPTNSSHSVSSGFSNTTITKSYHEICMYPETANLSLDYDTIFKHTEYDSTYLTDRSISVNSTLQTIEVFMVNTSLSTAITVTAVDENDDELVGYVIEAHRYNIPTNDYDLISSEVTDSNGKVEFNLDVSTYEYRFIVKNPSGTIVHTETKQKLVDTEYTLRVVLGKIPQSIFQKLNRLDISLTADRTNKNFTLTWTDIKWAVDSINLTIRKGNLTSDVTILSNQQSTLDDGSLAYHITESTTNVSVSYVATATVVSKDDGKIYVVDSVTMDFKKEWDIFGNESVIMAFLFVGTMMFIGAFISPTIAILLTIFGMISLWGLGFYAVSLSGLLALMVGLIILFVKVKER